MTEEQRDDLHIEQHGDGDVNVEQPTPDEADTPDEGTDGETGEE